MHEIQLFQSAERTEDGKQVWHYFDSAGNKFSVVLVSVEEYEPHLTQDAADGLTEEKKMVNALNSRVAELEKAGAFRRR